MASIGFLICLLLTFIYNQEIYSRLITNFKYWNVVIIMRSRQTRAFILILIFVAFIATHCKNPPQNRQVCQNYFKEGDPMTIKIQILNSTSTIAQHKIPILYSLNQPEQSISIDVPVYPEMGNYTIVTTIWAEGSKSPLSHTIQNLTRYAKIRNAGSTDLMMMDAGVSEKVDENTTYGLHLPVRFSMLVLFLDYPIPIQQNEYFWLFNFSKTMKQRKRCFVAPVDLSQMHVPFKSYKSIDSIHNHTHSILFSLRVYSFAYYQMFYGLTNRQLMMKANPLMAEIYTEQTIDLIKQTLFDNNFYLVVFYFTLNFIQVFMQIFAFKNQIKVWKSIEKNVGLSIKSLYQSLVCQIIICLYLYDKQANRLFFAFHLFDLALTIWKITRALTITLSSKNRFLLSVSYKEWYHRKVQTVDSEAIHYTNYLIAVLYSLFMIYKLYPVAKTGYTYYMKDEALPTPTLKQTYSFLLQSSVMFIFVLGFVMMTPQLYINYKLKSVDHLPWKTLIYRFISTIIDDIFVFMIDLPWLQRMFSFRDDVIFIAYLVQRKIYKVDKNRIALSTSSIDLSKYKKKEKTLQEQQKHGKVQ